MTGAVRAVLWDFGGVLSTSPFDAFAAYERECGLPLGFVRGLNATNPDTNAWAQLERSTVSFDEFCDLYEAEARAAGHELDARRVMASLRGALRPEMLAAVRRLKEAGFRQAVLTNNFSQGDESSPEVNEVFALFDEVVESRKTGVRKPDRRFYELACELMEIRPEEAVFLDDLGVNLKPAREMGMATIKVTDPDAALAELEAIVGVSLRG